MSGVSRSARADAEGVHPSVVVVEGPPGPPGPPGESGDADAVHAAIDAHRVDLTPHPVYDDTPDLTLIFENGLI